VIYVVPFNNINTINPNTSSEQSKKIKADTLLSKPNIGDSSLALKIDDEPDTGEKL